MVEDLSYNLKLVIYEVDILSIFGIDNDYSIHLSRLIGHIILFYIMNVIKGNHINHRKNLYFLKIRHT